MRLSRDFFQQKTLKVAQQLLGCFLIRQIDRQKIIGRIMETEAYCGPKDLANHASKGRTKRTEVMFGPAGHAYIYLIYGMYYCFNVVTEKEGYPGAVLIRGIEIHNSKSDMRKATIIGPGKVCRELKIDKSLHGVDLVKSNKLYIMNRLGDGRGRRYPCPWVGDSPCCYHSARLAERFTPPPAKKIKKLPRVGVDYAGKYKDKKWRFLLIN